MNELRGDQISVLFAVADHLQEILPHSSLCSSPKFINFPYALMHNGPSIKSRRGLWYTEVHKNCWPCKPFCCLSVVSPQWHSCDREPNNSEVKGHIHIIKVKQIYVPSQWDCMIYAILFTVMTLRLLFRFAKFRLGELSELCDGSTTYLMDSSIVFSCSFIHPACLVLTPPFKESSWNSRALCQNPPFWRFKYSGVEQRLHFCVLPSEWKHLSGPHWDSHLLSSSHFPRQLENPIW